jgi:serine/threonine protein kinase
MTQFELPQNSNRLVDQIPAKSLSDDDPLLGTIIRNRYLVEAALGYGGWGMVYSGHDKVLKRSVAIKVMHLPLASDLEKRKRFEREAKTSSQLIHPNIATVFDYGVLESGQPFLIMERLTGESLQQRLERDGFLSTEEALDVFVPLCEALFAAHQKGIVHRDIKPSNIFLCEVARTGHVTGPKPEPIFGQPLGHDVKPKILDFGIAKFFADDSELVQLTRTGETVGSPPYMSPEQCGGYRTDARSDIYSLGCTLYETLSGKQVFSGTAFECMTKHISEEPISLSTANPAASVLPSVAAVVHRALAKDSLRRFSDAMEFKRALIAAERGQFPKTSRISWRYSRYFTPASITVMALLSLILVVAILIRFSQTNLLATTGSFNGKPLVSSDPAKRAEEVLSILDKTDPKEAAELRANIAGARADLWRHPKCGIIFGQVVRDDFVDKGNPDYIASCCPIDDKGYFVYIADYSKPIDFVAHQYSRKSIDLNKLNLKGDLVWVGQTRLHKVTNSNCAGFRVHVAPPPGVKVKQIYAILTPYPKEPNANEEPWSNSSFTFAIPADGDFANRRCADTRYNIVFGGDRCLDQSRQVDLKAGETEVLQDVQLEKAPLLKVDYRVSKNPQFSSTPIRHEQFGPSVVFNYFEGLGIRELLTFSMEHDANGAVTSRELHAEHPFSAGGEGDGICDLGETSTLPHTDYDVSKMRFDTLYQHVIEPGHSYLAQIRTKNKGSCWLLFRLTEHY